MNRQSPISQQMKGTAGPAGPFSSSLRKTRRRRTLGRRRALVPTAALAALVGTGFVGAIAPAASAASVVQTQPYLIGTGSVNNVSVAAQPATAGTAATYTVGFSTPSGLVAGSDTITVNDPSGATTFPSTTSNYFVIDNSRPGYSQSAASVLLAGGAHGTYVGLRTSVPAGDSLTLAVIGALNPVSAGKYSLDVSTSKSTSPVASPTYDIVANGPSFSAAASVQTPSSPSTYTLGSFTVPAALSAGDLIAVSSYAGAGATDDVTFPGATSSYQLTDATNPAASGPPGSVSLTGVGAGQSGQTVLLKVLHGIAAGDRLSLSIAGVINPSSAQSDTVTAAAPSSATPATATLDIGMSVYDVSMSVSPTTAAATGAIYTIGFEPTTALPAGATVTLAGPPGTSFAGASVVLSDISHPSGSGTVGPASLTLARSGGSGTDNKVTFSVPNIIFAGDHMVAQVVNVTNPAAGTYGPTGTPMMISTGTDPVAVSLPTYIVAAAPAVVLPVLTASSASAGAATNYSITGLRVSAPMVAGSSTIELRAASGTVLPATSSAYLVSDLTNSALSFVPTVLSGANSNDVVLMANRSIPSGDNLSLSINGAVNPAPGRYTLSVIADVQGVTTSGAPLITSAASFRVLPGQYNAITITSTGSPIPHLSESGTLPAGLTFSANNNGTATISGTPPANAVGSYGLTITATNAAGSPAVQYLVLTLGSAPVITSAASFRVLPGHYNAFSITSTGSPVPYLSESGTLPPGLTFSANSSGTATISGTPPANTRGTYTVTVTATNGVGSPAVQYLVLSLATTATTTSVSSSANPALTGHPVTYTAKVVPVPNGGTVSFYADGAPVAACHNVAVSTTTGNATCTTTYSSVGQPRVQAFYSGHDPFEASGSGVYAEVVNLAAPGYWVATANGHVYGYGSAPSLGGVTTTAATGPVVGIAGTPSAQGYWVVTANGTVSAFGDAKFYGDPPALGKHISDIVAIAPTTDGKGYYLVGADGGFFTFGDAKFHGSLPGIHLHVKDVVGVVATPGGSGYLLVGSDGGVFTFGTTHFYGSLPGIGKHVHNIRAILPSSTGSGYILVGSDGGVFNFGTGAKFHGSLPGEGVKVSNIVGIALTPDNGGYNMAGADGRVFAFGNAQVWPASAEVSSNLPVAAIAGM